LLGAGVGYGGSCGGGGDGGKRWYVHVDNH
jgi:hypothetical protein